METRGTIATGGGRTLALELVIKATLIHMDGGMQ